MSSILYFIGKSRLFLWVSCSNSLACWKDTGKDLLSMGMLVTKENTLDVKVDNLSDLFECIPQEVTEDNF